MKYLKYIVISIIAFTATNVLANPEGDYFMSVGTSQFNAAQWAQYTGNFSTAETLFDAASASFDAAMSAYDAEGNGALADIADSNSEAAEANAVANAFFIMNQKRTQQ